jgi:gliding motility-associated-like protein
MKNFLRLSILLLFAVHAKAQYTTVTNLAGMVAYGTTNVTVTPGGSASATPWCGVSPYWIGSAGPGWYTYTFSPAVKAVRIYVTAMDVGFTTPPDTEKLSVFINGAFYTLTSANITTYAGTCAQPTEPAIGGQMVCTLDFGSGGGGQIDIAQCGITSCKVWTNGVLNGNCQTFQFDSLGSCFNAIANSPCLGDTLHLDAEGDSTGATYLWIGPGTITSTLQSFYFYPSTWADTGVYMAVRSTTVLGVVTNDTSYVHVTINPIPVVTAGNNSPLCAGMLDTLHLTETPAAVGETFSWTGPAGFISALQNPNINGFSAPDTGTYKVIGTTIYGCKDSATTHVTLVPPPPPDTITGLSNYCQGMPFVPFVVNGVLPGATVLWYTSAIGGTGSTTAPVINTSVPGVTTVWSSQIIGSCESPRTSFTVQVIHTPPAPTVTGIMQYCQFIGPFVPLTVSHYSGTDVIRWYTVAAGGTPSSTEPIPNINTVPPGGIYQYWVSLLDSGCEGPRTLITITIHPKPNPPTVLTQSYCQYALGLPVSATPSTAGDLLSWSGVGVTPGLVPSPNTSVAPDTFLYYVKETSAFGCASDSVSDHVVIKVKPQPPLTSNTRYCQKATAAPLNLLVDSAYNSHLNWYYRTLPVSLPTPPTDTIPTTFTWWVSQTVPSVNGCESDSATVSVEIVYVPVFNITASSPWVCQHDSIQLSYSTLGPSLFEPLYYWTLPQGAITVNSTNPGDSSIFVQFDTTNQYNRSYTVYLRASDDSGFCHSDTSISIKVIPLPNMTAYTKPDVCLGDTVQLVLSTRSANAYNYYWYVDYQTLFGSSALNIVTYNSNSGGPYMISWTDTGQHVIKVTSTTKEGCKSAPVYDSVDVHSVPDASFGVAPGISANSLCIEDSVLFNARTVNYNYAYEWSPGQYFNNENKPNIWGRIRDAKSIITLKVTDPYGCYATQSMEIDPGSCCTLLFPNAFAPNALGAAATNGDNVFRPVYTGYHQFHLFRIANRWGQTVFQSANSSDARWDGTFNGVPQDMGTYYYYIKYDCGGSTFEQKGDVTLIR